MGLQRRYGPNLNCPDDIFRVRCDGCGKEITIIAISFMEARDILKEKGWVQDCPSRYNTVAEKWFCPNHKNDGKPRDTNRSCRKY